MASTKTRQKNIPVKKAKASIAKKKTAASSQKVKTGSKKSKAVKQSKPAAKKAVTKISSKSKVSTVKKPVKKVSKNKESGGSKQKPALVNKSVLKKGNNSARSAVINKTSTNKKNTPSKGKAQEEKTRYSDKELMEFKKLILHKIEEARKELTNLQAALNSTNDHGTDDTASTFKVLEDGSDTLAKEEAGQLAARQKKFIEQLENALIRIENKTYGICRVTGKLIPEQRLRAVPHTTQCIEAKRQQYND